MSGQRVPDAVLAAIAAAIAQEMGAVPERLHVRLAGETPPEGKDQGWRLAARLAAMRPGRWPCA